MKTSFSTHRRRSHIVSLVVTGLCGAVLSTAIAIFVWNKQTDAWQERFDNGVRQRQQLIRNLIEDALISLDRVGRFIEASERVSPDEFDYYNRPMLANFTGIYLIQPVPAAGGQPLSLPVAPVARVPPHDLRSACRPLDPDWRYPVLLLSAPDPAAGTLGLDLRCDATRVAAMQQARDEGRVVATRQVRRLMHNGQTMALFRPVYARNVGDSVEARRAGLRGFVSAGATMEVILAPSLRVMKDSGHYTLTLTDIDPAGELRLLSLGVDQVEPRAASTVLMVDVAGRSLRLEIGPSRTFWQQRHDETALLVWLAGISFTLLMLAWLRSQDSRRIQAEMLAIARNDDVIDREARLAALFQHAPIAILRCDDQGMIVDANPATGRLLSCSESALPGAQYISLFSPWAAQTFRQRWQEPSWLELELVSPVGEPIPVLVRTLSMRQPDGTPYAWAMIEDLRVVRHNERLKREFVATISHELRTPLTAIKGAIELVQTGAMGECPAEVGQLLDMAAQNAESLNQLINDLLDVERLEQGKLSLRTREQALLPLVELARRQAQPLLNDKSLGWDMQVEEGGLRVRVDGDRLVQVFKNLFSNAVKFSPQGGRIGIDIRRRQGQVCIRVSDQGSGIPEDFMPRLFQPFAQADGSDHRAAGGSGLGLAISRGLIERMGGHIHAESVTGQGATFIIELPCPLPDDSQAGAEEKDHDLAQYPVGR